MSYNYLSLGYDCSPASALRTLNLRDYALPFDWISSSTQILKKCLETNFENFHKNIYINKTHTRIIDSYGFEYPHDYPLITSNDFQNQIGEGIFDEGVGKVICSNWQDYHNIVLDKYNRRIERFRNIIKDNKPIIVLCRYYTHDVIELQKIFMEVYNIDNIYFVNSSYDEFENDKIKNVYTEKNNIWNESNLWKQGIDDIILKINK